jgi:hypothetical protein
MEHGMSEGGGDAARITALRASLDQLDPSLTSTARVGALIELGRLLLGRFEQRSRPDPTDAMGDLDEAHARLFEAYGQLPVGDVRRARVAGQLGNIYAFRSAFTGISAADNDTAIRLHDEAIEHPELSPAGREQLLLFSALPRALRALPSAEQMARLGRTDTPSLLQNMSWLATGLTPQRRHDLELATRRLQRVVDGPAVDGRVQELATRLLQLVGVLRAVFGVEGPLGMANALSGLELLWAAPAAGLSWMGGRMLLSVGLWSTADDGASR